VILGRRCGRFSASSYNGLMCGRYRLSRRAEILAGYFNAEHEGMDWEARYNIAPTQTVSACPVVSPSRFSLRSRLRSLLKIVRKRR
jgi:hypothetical protein